MSPADDDSRLRAALAEAHRADPTAPPFARVWGAQRRPAARARRWVFAGGLAAAAALVTWVAVRPAPAPPTWRPSGTRWVAPTDFLLDTPDLVTLRTLPSLAPEGLP